MSPTLRVHPGDELVIHLHNDLPVVPGVTPNEHHSMAMPGDDDCSGGRMDLSTTNLHFHGMTIPPTCHQDEVMRTAIHAGQEFDYFIKIPDNEQPGLYWYHPHPHGFGERQIQGGASGAIIVEGIESIVPSLANYPERVILLRDQQRIGMEGPGPLVPSWDISTNFVPITYPRYDPPTIETRAGRKEFWRVVNASADTIFNLQYLIGKSAQPVEMISIDGIAMASPLRQTKILLPPGSRAEFVMTTPGKAESAELITQAWDTGPAGDNDPRRALAKIVSSSDAPEVQPKPTESASIQQPATGATSKNAPVAQRMLYFSQRSSNPQDPDNFVLYFVTVQGQTPKPYKMGSSPDIVVHQGDVEDWTVENRSPEDHVFHIHQIHFKVLEVNGKPVQDPAMRDTFDLPYWSGKGPYPSVKLRMDFTDPNTVGTFLYHCHILKHEDMGMMGSIQVLPKKPDADAKLTHPSSSAPMNSEHMAGDNSPVQQ